MSEQVRRRVSLTRVDLQSTAGLGLLEILQSIADDGQLTPEEVDQLRSWLSENSKADLPAFLYLQAIVSEVLKDGLITDGEFDLLHDAVLRVLPTDLRSIATLRRRERKAAVRGETKRAKEEERERKRADSERDRAIGRADFMVAGATRGGDRREACEACSPGDSVWLEREPDNSFDSNAILVTATGGDVLGYAPKEQARDLAPLLDAGARQDFTVKKCLETSSGAIIPVVCGCLYRADALTGDPSSSKVHRVTGSFVEASDSTVADLHCSPQLRPGPVSGAGSPPRFVERPTSHAATGPDRLAGPRDLFVTPATDHVLGAITTSRTVTVILWTVVIIAALVGLVAILSGAAR